MLTRSENLAPCARLVPLADDPAVKDAREVVGLYGDPDTSWGIAVDVGVAPLVPRLEPEVVVERLCRAVRRRPHLGAAPEVELVDDGAWSARRAALAAASYDRAALMRVAVRTTGAGSRSAPITERWTGSAWSPSLPRRSASRCTREPGGSETDQPGLVSFAPASRGWARRWSTHRRSFGGRGEDSSVEDLSELSQTAPCSWNRTPGRRGRAGVR